MITQVMYDLVGRNSTCNDTDTGQRRQVSVMETTCTKKGSEVQAEPMPVHGAQEQLLVLGRLFSIGNSQAADAM